MGDRVDYRCWEIIDEPDDIEPGQTSIADVDDADLEFKPFGYVTETPEEIAYRCLVKDRKARTLDLWALNNVKIGGLLSTFTVDSAAGAFLAVNDDDVASLIIGEDTLDALIIGNGSFDGAHSLVAATVSYLGVQNGGHSEANFNYGLCVGQGIDADGDYNVITGSGHDVNGNITRVHGQNVTLTESYIDAFGVQLTGSHQHSRLSGLYAKSIAKGADCRSLDRYNSQDGNLQRTVLDVVGITNGNTGTVVLRPMFSDTGPTFTLDDETIAHVHICLFSTIKNATNGIGHGYRIDYRKSFVCWHNGGYTASDVAESFSAIARAFTPTMELHVTAEGSSGQFEVFVVVDTNTNSDIIIHRAKVEIITGPTSFNESS